MVTCHTDPVGRSWAPRFPTRKHDGQLHPAKESLPPNLPSEHLRGQRKVLTSLLIGRQTSCLIELGKPEVEARVLFPGGGSACLMKHSLNFDDYQYFVSRDPSLPPNPPTGAAHCEVFSACLPQLILIGNMGTQTQDVKKVTSEHHTPESLFPRHGRRHQGPSFA